MNLLMDLDTHASILKIFDCTFETWKIVQSLYQFNHIFNFYLFSGFSVGMDNGFELFLKI